MSNIMVGIEKARQEIFEYDTKNAVNNIVLIIEDVYSLMLRLDAVQKSRMNEVIKYLSIAVENKDYLLAADILEYELNPLVISA